MPQEQKITAIENKIRGEVPRLGKIEDYFPHTMGAHSDTRDDVPCHCNYPQEIHLEDLLFVIDKIGGVGVRFVLHSGVLEIYSNTDMWSCNYVISKSFKENLESNPELTDFLFNLICIK